MTYLLLVACLWTVSLAGCANSKPAPRVACGACEEADRYVRVQRHIHDAGGNGSSGFDHPFPLSSHEWHSILETIQVQRLGSTFFLLPKSKEAVDLAFTPKQVEYLSHTLPKAFAEAQSEDWVVFALGKPQSDNLMLVTTGAWYVQEPLLYLVLANYDAAVTMPIIREELNRDPLYDVTGSPPFTLIPSTFMKKVTAHKSLLGYLKSKPPTIAIEYKQLLSTPEPPSIPEVRDQTERTPITQDVPASSRPSSLEERLEQLKRLHDKNLITEDDFERKKKELLDQL